jgi:hypothetical protein
MRKSITETALMVSGGDDGRDLICCPPGSIVTARLPTPEECQESGLDWRTAPWVWAITPPGGEEQLFPITGRVCAA